MFYCPRFTHSRTELLGTKATWEEVEVQDWKKAGEEENTKDFEAVEDRFGYLHWALRNTEQTQGMGWWE